MGQVLQSTSCAVTAVYVTFLLVHVLFVHWDMQYNSEMSRGLIGAGPIV